MQKYQQTQKEVRCPICYANTARLLWEVTSKQAAQHYVLKEKYPEKFAELTLHIEHLWRQNSCEVVQCAQCGFCYSNPYIAGDEKFYNLAYVRSGYPTWKWEFQKTYDVLRQYSKPNIKLLEIGAGDGKFVKRIVVQNILPKENILCTEFSEYGKRQIEKLGVKCLSEDIRNLSIPELAEIDNICMFQVLEHMDRLDDLFQKLNKMMKLAGSLFIAVPNPKIIEFNELNNALLDMPPNHIGRWNRTCFEKIGERNGFYVKDCSIETYKFASTAKEFLTFHFLRNSHQRGRFENQIQQIKNPRWLRIFQIIGLAFSSITALPALTKMNSELGNSLWVHLVKKNNL